MIELHATKDQIAPFEAAPAPVPNGSDATSGETGDRLVRADASEAIAPVLTTRPVLTLTLNHAWLLAARGSI